MAVKQKPTKSIPTEIGATGVYSRTVGSYYQEAIKELSFPYSLETYDKMMMDVTIASAITAVNVIANRVPIYVEAYDQSPTHQKRAEFVRQCFNDMQGDTLDSVIQKALTFNRYGFSVLEKVFYRRRFKNGSKYDDGKIGVKYLPMRRQHSLTGFKWDDKFREFKGFYQNTKPTPRFDYYGYSRSLQEIKNNPENNGDKLLPKNRVLHFKVDLSTDLPESISPLYYAYEGWRELQRYKDLENVSSSKNMNGVLVGRIPEEYLAPDADDDMKKAGKAFQAGITNIGRNEQVGIVIPSTRTEENSPEWDITTLQSSSSHVTSISSIVQRLQNELLQLMFADALTSGADMSEVNKGKKSFLNIVVEIRIKEILRVLNTDLIPDLFARNGWDSSKIPTFKYGELEEVDMAVFAKAMQQLKATKLIPVTPQVINKVLEVMGFTYRVSDDISKEELDELLGVEEKDDSRSGDGLAKGSGNGTSDKPSEDDRSASNLDNR